MQAAGTGKRKPKRSRWGPDDAQEGDVPQQPAASMPGQPPPQAHPAASRNHDQPILTNDTSGSVTRAAAPSPTGAAAEAEEVGITGTTAAAAVEEALQATGLAPVTEAVAEGHAEGGRELQQQPLELAQPAERFALPEGVDPLAAVLLRHREDAQGVITSAGAPGTPASQSASDASEAAEDQSAKLDVPVSSEPPAHLGKPSQQSILQSLQQSQSSAPVTTSHVQARLASSSNLFALTNVPSQNGGLHTVMGLYMELRTICDIYQAC